jgi:hypothetical protein
MAVIGNRLFNCETRFKLFLVCFKNSLNFLSYQIETATQARPQRKQPMDSPILLIGSLRSENIQLLVNHCQRYQQAYICLDTQVFFDNNAMFIDNKNELLLNVDNLIYPIKHFKGIFWDSISLPHGDNVTQLNFSSWLQVFFNQRHPNWCNSWDAFQFHKTKPLQLELAKRLGAKVPDSFFGNDVKSAYKFIERYSRCIVKPIHGGKHTRLIGLDDLAEIEQELQKQPLTIQKYIEGTNVRTYVVGTVLFSAIIESDSIDFRQDDAIKLMPIVLPKHIEKLAFTIMQSFHMQWTAIDWRRTCTGEYVFLEANPAPRFAEFERLTHYPISEYLFKLLTKAPYQGTHTNTETKKLRAMT